MSQDDGGFKFMPIGPGIFTTTKPAAVYSPPHYTAGEIECIDALKAGLTEEMFQGFCLGNAIKYIWRERGKGGDEDIQKAIWYLRMARGDDPRKEKK